MNTVDGIRITPTGLRRVLPVWRQWVGGGTATQVRTRVRPRRLRIEPLEARCMLAAASADNLAVTEINYNPAPPGARELRLDPNLENDQFEFIELLNTSDESVDLLGVHFSAGVEFDFNNASQQRIEPGEFLVLVRDLAAFEARYGASVHVLGQFASGGLSNGGEQITLLDYQGDPIFSCVYNDSGQWPVRADGLGSTLESTGTAIDYNDARNWRASVEVSGSPGRAGSGMPLGVRINEVLSHTDPPQSDSVEIYNLSAGAVDLSGWYLSDSSANYQKYQIPPGTWLPPDSYLVFDEGDFNASMGASESDFRLNGAHGDDVWLIASDELGDPWQFVDHVEFGAQANGESWGRWPNAVGPLYPMTRPTLGRENPGPRVGPLVISEIMYRPMATSSSQTDLLEYVEIFNPSDRSLNLAQGRLRGGVDFDFLPEHIIGAGETITVLPLDPNDPAKASQVEDFLRTYALDGTESLVGPYLGRLSDSGEEIRLYRPDEPPSDEPDYYPQLLEDTVRYDVNELWPISANGGGASLTRTSALAWGNDPRSWGGAPPTPGAVTGSLVVESVQINAHQQDPPDLPAGTQPTSWSTQRSSLRDITITFSFNVQMEVGNLWLTHLGLDPENDLHQRVSLTDQHVSVDGNVLTISFAAGELADGAYELLIGPEIYGDWGFPLDGNRDGIAGDPFVMTADSQNRLYQLSGDNNGDFGVSIFDFPTFSYWFGRSVPSAPEYADLFPDGGVSIFDFPSFAANFGRTISLPGAAGTSSYSTPPRSRPVSRRASTVVVEVAPESTATRYAPSVDPWRTPSSKKVSNRKSRADSEVDARRDFAVYIFVFSVPRSYDNRFAQFLGMRRWQSPATPKV